MGQIIKRGKVMKIRNGFVSNSSSASFVILYRNQIPCEHCGIQLDIEELFKNRGETEIDLNGIDDFEENIEDYNRMGPTYYSDISKEYQSYIKEAMKPENKNKKLMEVSISYHDEFAHNIFNALVKKGDIIVLNNCS